ncbi:serine/threonine-protein kinase [Ramlibacter sp.]|uniref:CHASE2 domain-containing serine/threonine-protein kinase n=1 Tax=Ramlibacter sp. TaxID=1917967 RepID=UPI0026025A8D|nr:serine/threonine-protein kinase [Ramlibacter sp.]MDB5954962.1 serine/threonine protein kinase [Ramlibacter sp.]
MSTSSSARRGRFWRTDWFAGLLVVVAVVLLYQATDFIGTLERRFYDYASTATSRKPSDRIAIIAIDDQSIANIGRWPWPRDVHAELIDKLAAAKAKTIVHTAFFFEPQTDRGLAYIRKIKEALGHPGGNAGIQHAEKLIADAEQALDTDGKLAAAMARAGNVLTPSVFGLGEPQGRPDKPLSKAMLKYALDDSNAFSLASVSAQQPIESIGNAAAGIGHLNQSIDVDGSVRYEPMLVNYYGKAVPSMALLAAARSLNLNASDIRLNVGDSVQIGRLKVRTDGAARMLPQFYPTRDGKPAFAVDSFYDVLTGKIPASKYADKIVLIGATAAGVGTPFPAPGGQNLTPVELMAHITSSILSEHFIVQPAWSLLATLGALLLVAGYIVTVLPRLSAGMGGAVTAALFVLLLGAEFGLLSGASVWVQLVFPATLLLIGHVALTTKRFLITEAGKVRADEESAETNRMMGLALQGQGQLDMAFDRFQRVPVGDEVMANLYNLALDFERKRQFNKAEAVYEHMARHNRKYKDLEAKLNRAKNLSETVMLGGGSTHPGGTLLLAGGEVEKPMLGRYQVEKELGKGAMGVVYQGRDPKIGREVAIKTMALAQEFEGEELNDARERFFREAETAGRLQHQNIVTIFDAGEEHDLAYIAMEFLKGSDLAEHCKPGKLLPVPRVLAIVARVAEALAYAHRQSVVHRDIKPANIMYELASDTVKVTDFGIARITDSSKTRTGLVLGTPSFMSPEQIAGKHVDGRSDLYSLGVTLFQMLAGTLPFRGESMAELMYKIANEDTPDLRAVRPELPQRLVEIVGRTLAKKPDLRYQDGDELARDLRALAAAESAAPAAGAATGSAAPAAAPAAASCAPDPEQTVAVSLAARASARTAQPADNALQRAVPTSALPGYDAAQKESGPAGQAGPGTTPVTNTPGAPDQPRAGGGQAGQEP